MKIILTLVLSIFLINVNLVNAAGFDCSKASTNVEKIICSNEELSKLDDQNTLLFKQYKSVSNDLYLTVQDQRDWLKHKRSNCLDAPCLEDIYHKRNAYLKSSIESNQITNMADSMSDIEVVKNEPLEEVIQTKNGVEAQVATTIAMTDATEETVPVKQTDLTKIKEEPLSTANQIPQQFAESVLGTQEASITRPFTARYAHVLSGLIILLVFFSGLSFPVLMRKVF